jgi:hypothetical protein
MAEIAAVLALVAGTGMTIAAGVTYGTRYIDGQLSRVSSSRTQPLVRPIDDESQTKIPELSS